MTLIVPGMMLVILWSGGVGSANAGLLYSQPANFPGGNASQNAPNAFASLYVAFDNFTLTRDAFITGVRWQGSYFNPSIQGSISQFEIIFWSDAAGLPGNALQTYGIPGNAGERFVGIDSGFLKYDYATNLSTPFAAYANTIYWLSIQPTVDFPPQWYWRAGTGGDGQSANIIRSVSPDPFPILQDLAFSLVAEPPSSLLLGLGLTALVGSRVAGRQRRT